jgi:hypothetical protein
MESKRPPLPTPPPMTPGRSVALAVLEDLDGNEGWFEAGDSQFDWYPYRHRVCITWNDDPACAVVEAGVVAYSSGNSGPLELVNRINIAASCWSASIDENGRLVFHTSIGADDVDIFGGTFGAHRLSAAAEHLANRLTAPGGGVMHESHPTRGRRNTPDGWLSSAGHGVAQEGTSALSVLLTPAEVQRIGAAFEQVLTASFVAESDGREWRWVTDTDDCAMAMTIQHHPDLGFGLRIAVPCGRPEDPLRAAAGLNRHLRAEMVNGTAIGAFVAFDDFVSYVAFIPALEVEKWAAQDIIRAIRGTIRPALQHAIPVAEFRVPVVEPDPFWTGLRTAPVQNDSHLASSDLVDLWRTSRDEPLLAWLYFNPAGPTVSTLQVVHTIDEHVLIRFDHHPMFPSGEVIAVGARPALLAAARAYASDPEAMFPGGLPTCIMVHDPSIVAALQTGLSTTNSRLDVGRDAALLSEFPGDPWGMLEAEMRTPPKPHKRRIFDRNRTDRWFEAATDPVHVLGCVIALRSAWEASKHFALGDTASASATAGKLRRLAASRLRGGVSAVDERTAKTIDDLSPISWDEVRTSALGFLDVPGPATQEVRDVVDGVEWYTQGVRVRISATSSTIDDNEVIFVDMRTEVAELAQDEVGLAIVERFNAELPLSVLVVEDRKISMRSRILLTSTGRTLLQVVRIAALLQADYAARARQIIAAAQSDRIWPASDGIPTPEQALPPFPAAMRDAVDGDGEWFAQRWSRAREHMTRTMLELGWPVGWGNQEVQHYNEMPPDVAVAFLDPPDPHFTVLGAGVVVVARIVAPQPGLEESFSSELLNQCNTYMLQLPTTVLAPLRCDKSDMVGLRTQACIPVAGFLDRTHGDRALGTALANVASHLAQAPFTVLRILRGDETS